MTFHFISFFFFFCEYSLLTWQALAVSLVGVRVISDTYVGVYLSKSTRSYIFMFIYIII